MSLIAENQMLFLILWPIIVYLLFKLLSRLFVTQRDENNNNQPSEYPTDNTSTDESDDQSSGPLRTGDKPQALYPNGWIPVCESNQLKKGKIMTVKIFGGELVVFRGNSGQAHVIDAHCPHLGAHLGHGGKVACHDKQDCIQCPFHSWSFRASDGQCVDIPYAEGVPNGVKVRVWESVEVNGFVLVWHHDRGYEPDWWPELVPEIQSGKWTYKGSSDSLINCYFQEIPETSADIYHCDSIHKQLSCLPSDLEQLKHFNFIDKFMHHHSRMTWGLSAEPGQKHVAITQAETTIQLFNKPLVTFQVYNRLIGPGIFHFKISGPFGIEAMFVQGIIPVAAKQQRFVRMVFCNRSVVGWLLGKLLLWFEAGFMDRDAYVWNRKIFLKNPIIIKEEKALKTFRRWFKQFYSSDKLDW